MVYIVVSLLLILFFGISLYLFLMYTKSKKLNALLKQKNAIYQNRNQATNEESDSVSLQKAIEEIGVELFNFYNKHYAPIERLSISSFLKQSKNKKGNKAIILALYTNKSSAFKVGDELELSDFAGIETLKTGQDVIVDDLLSVESNSALDKDLKEAGIRSSLTIPLLSKGDLIGAMKISSISPNRFKNKEFIKISEEISEALAFLIKQAADTENTNDTLNKLNQKNKKAWEMSLAVHKQKEEIDEKLKLNKLELEKIEAEKEKIKQRNKKLWETSVNIHNEKEQIEKIKIEIEEKHKNITDSISYAKRIQQALMPAQSLLKENFDDHFVLFKPRDIVSGDFFWALTSQSLTDTEVSVEKSRNLLYLCAADCTGHGVPGAFMSLLNIAFLNEAVREKNITEPHFILNHQRSQIIRALNPKGNENTKDGMDCALCVFDFDKMLLKAALSNNPLWIVRNKELIEYKPDKMPVGKHDHDHISFKLNTIELNKGDIVYILTDGFADQFGGPHGKKFKYKPLKELLTSMHGISLGDQYDTLLAAFQEWKGEQEQVDDVCLIGIKI